MNLNELESRARHYDSAGYSDAEAGMARVVADLIAHLRATTASDDKKTHEEMPEHIADCREEMARRRDYLQAKLGDTRQWRNFYDLCDAMTERLTTAQARIAELDAMVRSQANQHAAELERTQTYYEAVLGDLRAKLEAAQAERSAVREIVGSGDIQAASRALVSQRDEARADLERVTKERDAACRSERKLHEEYMRYIHGEREKRAGVVPVLKYLDVADRIEYTDGITPTLSHPKELVASLNRWLHQVWPVPVPTLDRAEAERLIDAWWTNESYPTEQASLNALTDLLLSTVAKYGSGVVEHVVEVDNIGPSMGAAIHAVLLNGVCIDSYDDRGVADAAAGHMRTALAYGRAVDVDAMVAKAREEALREGFAIAEDNAEVCDHNGWHPVTPHIDWETPRAKLEELIAARTASGAGEKGEVGT